MNKQGLRFLLTAVAVATGLVTLLACSGTSANSASATSITVDAASRAILTIEDLPDAWRKGEVTTKTISGAVRLAVGFLGARDPSMGWINVGQEIYVYPSQESATAAYEQQIAAYFPVRGDDGWQPAPELEFTSRADRMTIACLPVRINGEPVTTCTAVSQYRNMIEVVGSNLYKDQWMTVEGFRKVLAAMDRRAVAVLSGQ